MTLTELQSHLKSAGLVPVLVENSPPEEHHKRLMFAGTLQEYVEAVKAFQLRAVIVYSENIEESDFEAEADDDDDVLEAPVNLCVINRSLAQYEKRIGETGLLWLSVSLGDEHLDLAMHEPWWVEFLSMRDEAVQQLSLEGERRRAALDSSKRIEAAELIADLHALADDLRFAKLPTQKAMLQYALRAVPKLKGLKQELLKVEIQELKAKIDAGVK
jgi:hypothetical protein